VAKVSWKVKPGNPVTNEIPLHYQRLGAVILGFSLQMGYLGWVIIAVGLVKPLPFIQTPVV
jgi:hypothetical protein